jgi:hypothetical protein
MVAFDPLVKVRKGDLVYVRCSKGDRFTFKVFTAR